MNCTDIASIVFVCVTANHLGLVKAIEAVVKMEVYIINCPKCFTFWSVLAYSVYCGLPVIEMLAISFLCSYLAIWLELLEGFIDILYLRIYDKIYDTKTDTLTAADFDGDTSSSMS